MLMGFSLNGALGKKSKKTSSIAGEIKETERFVQSYLIIFSAQRAICNESITDFFQAGFGNENVLRRAL